MKTKMLTLATVFPALLVGCGGSFSANESPLQNSPSNTEAPVEVLSSAKIMMTDLESSLRGQEISQGSLTKLQVSATSAKLNLNEAQIQTILAAVSQALQGAQLGSSNDLKAILPVLIQGATQGIGVLKLDSALLSQILATVGNSSLNSIVNLSNGSVPTELLEMLTSSLFANLGQAGASGDALSAVADKVIASLLAKLNVSDLDASGFKEVLKSLASGSIAGLDKMKLSETLMKKVMDKLGSGSLSGLTSLVSSLTSSTGTGSDLLSGLLDAFTKGVSEKLQNSKKGALLSALFNSYLNGVNNSQSQAAASTSSPIKTVIGSVVGGVISNWLNKI